VRWLDGMLTNDVAALAERGPGAGCYALLLTAQGRVVADLHVLLHAEKLWLETERAAVVGVLERLNRFIVADDVTLVDCSDAIGRLAVEGPAAPKIFAALTRGLTPPEADAHVAVELDGVDLFVADFSLSGGFGFQVFASPDAVARVHDTLLDCGRERGLIPAGSEALEILRIEAGIPRLGVELDESVLPDEARLERAISTSKGCYTGQEVVARLRSRGGVKHLLVGLACEHTTPPAAGAAVAAAGARIGEVTSATVSPERGAIALAYVRRPHDAPGTRVDVDGIPARVVDLPFVVSGA
jgi:aminomethyltransferase